jgi:hypothetical protein
MAIAETRKCTFCGKKALRLDSDKEISESFDQDTGEFNSCMFDSTWELCKEVGDESKAGTYIYFKNGNAVGRFRELQ